MVIRSMCWAEPMRGGKVEKYKEDLIAAGHTVIKAFTLLEIEIVCKVLALFLSAWRHCMCFF
jgi:hypothetical protein